MKILSVMDPLEKLSLEQDTTVGFMNVAVERGHEVHICTAHDLYLDGDQAWAMVTRVTMPKANQVQVQERLNCSLTQYDCVWMRTDPPVDQSFVHTTYILDFANTWVINPPHLLRNFNEKLYALKFIDDTPHTRIASSPDLIMDWLKASDESLIVKPLDGYGGLGVCLLNAQDRNTRVTLELLTDLGSKRVVVQKYLPSARKGDHRVLVVNGRVAGAILRTPQEDDHRGNIHVGGKVTHLPLNDEELKLCERVAKHLKADGIFFAGLDLIGGMITEINITSPTGIREYKALTGISVGEIFLKEIETELQKGGAV
ncbi:MAG: glutathione synthase [Myxococcales bacterium]|nr:glutathione synthase [Myxococcales bacterium]